MEFTAREFQEEYKARIVRLRRQLAERTVERLKVYLPDSTAHMVGRALLGNEFSLFGDQQRDLFGLARILPLSEAGQTANARYHLGLGADVHSSKRESRTGRNRSRRARVFYTSQIKVLSY